MRINLIAAVGKRGQLGLNGAMPWHNKEDLGWFRHVTMGDHVLMGSATACMIADLLDGRRCWSWSREIEPQAMIEMIKERTDQERCIWIAGGARTYEAFMPFVERSFITHIDYDGEADTWMPSLWRNP